MGGIEKKTAPGSKVLRSQMTTLTGLALVIRLLNLHVEIELREVESPMSEVFFQDSEMSTMERFMDLAARRQTLIAGNIANVDTPEYKTVDINFEQELKAAVEGGGLSMKVTNSRHIPRKVDMQGRGEGTAQEVEGLTLRNDLNNVSIDREMAEMSTNALKFSTVAQLIATKFRTLKSAILEGR